VYVLHPWSGVARRVGTVPSQRRRPPWTGPRGLSQTGLPRPGIRDARRPGDSDGGLRGDEFELRPAGFLVAMVSEDESKLWTVGSWEPWWWRPDGAQWHP